MTFWTNLQRYRLSRGFTLIELLVALGVTVILLTVAANSLSRTVHDSALTVQAEAFVTALRFARSEAQKRQTRVTVCAREPAAPGYAPQCVLAVEQGWQFGWVVFVDHGAVGVIDRGDQVLRLAEALVPSGGVVGTARGLSFAATGISLSAASHFEFLPLVADAAARASAARWVCLAKSGRPRVLPAGQTGCVA